MEEPREEDFYMEEWTEVKDGKKSVPLNHVEYESALRMYIKHLQSQLKNHGVSHHVIKCDTCIVDENKAAQGLHVCGICDMPMDLSD